MRVSNNFFLYCLFLAWICEEIRPSFHGHMQHFLYKEPLKTSLKTHDFLKKSLVLQPLFIPLVHSENVPYLINSMIAIDQGLVSAGLIALPDVEIIFNLVNQAKRLLFQQAEISVGLEASRLSTAWWQYLLVCLKQVQVHGNELDVKYLQQKLGDFTQLDYMMLKRLFLICNDIMHHFDGVMVTEYDFLVLSHVAIALVVLAGV